MNAVMVGDDDFVVLSQRGSWDVRELTRIHGGQEEEIAVLHATDSLKGEALVMARSGEWWYSRHYRDGTKSSVAFVTSNESKITRKEVTLREPPLIWLPFHGTEPGGIVVSAKKDLPEFLVDEVSLSGVKPAGTYEGHFPGSVPLPNRWSAERLPDGGIALLSIEQPLGGAWRFMLRVFRGGNVVETRLPCGNEFNDLLVRVVDLHGRLAVAGVSKARQVVAMIIDPDHPGTSGCRVISEPSEVAADISGGQGSPSLAASDEGFLVAWIRDDGTVRACQLGNLSSAPIVSVGNGADFGHPLPELMHVDQEDRVTFAWSTDHGLIIRRLPQALGGYALLQSIQRLSCDTISNFR